MFKNFDWKKYFLFHFKWQIGIIVTLPLMYLFLEKWHFPYWLAIMCFNFVGAIIFFPVDSWIFKNKKKS